LTATQKKFLAYCERTGKATAAAILAYKNVNKKLKVVESLLYSAAMNQEIQIPHRDLEGDYADSAVLCLLALEEETTILLTKGTHEMDYDRRNYFISRYELSKGDILFFHPCLIHAGDAYGNSNLRLHYYVFVKSAEWDINQTYLLDNEDEEMLRSQMRKFRSIHFAKPLIILDKPFHLKASAPVKLTIIGDAGTWSSKELFH